MKAFLRSSKTLWYVFYSKDEHNASGTKWLSCVKMPQLKQCAAKLNKLRNIKATHQDTYRIQQSSERLFKYCPPPLPHKLSPGHVVLGLAVIPDQWHSQDTKVAWAQESHPAEGSA